MTEDRKTFPWTETRALLLSLWKQTELRLAPDGRSFESGPGEVVRFTPPAVQPIPEGIESVTDYLDRLEDELGLHVALLIRAGVSALGIWREEQLLVHKIIRKYVVRGQGRAQPTHLKTRGKSRYGSRLRLQGARAQLEETNQRLLDWRREYGTEDRFFLSGPVRLLADLRRADPAPPDSLQHALRIRLPVRDPSHAELLRVRRLLCRGSIERWQGS
ncbi:MAG: hypothetical protein V2A76_01395 [Planctomycetota bacterium]